MKEIAHRPGMRERTCRITRVKFRRTSDDEPVVYITLTADDGGEVFHDQFILDRDLARLQGLRWATGWSPTLAGEKVMVLLDADGAILGYGPAGQLATEYYACKRKKRPSNAGCEASGTAAFGNEDSHL
jgi:hypothetical protein